MSTFSVWLLVLVVNKTDDASIIAYYHTQKACQAEEVVVEAQAKKNPEFLKQFHYECVEGEVLHQGDGK